MRRRQRRIPGSKRIFFLQIDLHEEIDGFDDLAKKVLSSQGMAMSLAAPGRSWRREGAKVVQFEVECEALTHLEMQKRQPWVFFGPGKSGRNHFCEEESRYLRLSGWAPRTKRSTRSNRRSHG